MNENEYIKECMPIILSLLAGKRKQMQVVSEVPRDYGSNNNLDILLIDRHKKEMMTIEFKLKNYNGLRYQVNKNGWHKIRSIGVINSKKDRSNNNIFNLSVPGTDFQVEKLLNQGLSPRWTSALRTNISRIYWYGYMFFDNFSIENAGTPAGIKLPFHELYKMAMRNIIKTGIDFDLIYSVLGVYYHDTAKKHYRDLRI